MPEWVDDPDMTESEDGYDRPLMGLTGGQRARPGDSYTLTFEGNGEKVETENGDSVAFDAVYQGGTFAPVTGDNDDIEEGDDIRLMTSSARFLGKLKSQMPVAGKTLRINIEGTGYDAAYSVGEAE